jgi:hypothetical protein
MWEELDGCVEVSYRSSTLVEMESPWNAAMPVDLDVSS